MQRGSVLTARGRTQPYALFAELFLKLIAPRAAPGSVVPTGIATDDYTKAYFDEVTAKRRLFSLFDFENREKLFAPVDSRMKFCLVTLAGVALETTFTFFGTRTEQLRDQRRRFTLSPQDIARSIRTPDLPGVPKPGRRRADQEDLRPRAGADRREQGPIRQSLGPSFYAHVRHGERQRPVPHASPASERRRLPLRASTGARRRARCGCRSTKRR